MSRNSRKSKIEQLERLRGSKVITYVTSTRANVEAQMAMDAIEPIYHHLRAVSTGDEKPKIDLFLYTNGGEGIVPWRLVTLVREYSSAFNVLVPCNAFSAGTLTALGADRVVMHPMGMLGPTDPTVANQFNPTNPLQPNQLLGISVEDVASYFALVKDDVEITHEDELVQALTALTDKVHPLALGNVKRSTQQSRMMGEKLLRRRNHDESMSEHEIAEIVRKLTSELYFHGHPINRREAVEELGLRFVESASDDVAEAMWGLYSEYAQDMKLRVPFNGAQEALAKTPLPPASPPGAMVQLPNGQVVPQGGGVNQTTVVLDPVIQAIIESTARCDVHDTTFEVVMTRDHAGNVGATATATATGWSSQ